jgi:hypothetical protein
LHQALEKFLANQTAIGANFSNEAIGCMKNQAKPISRATLFLSLAPIH